MTSCENVRYKINSNGQVALNIIINAISVWNTVYLQQATKHRKKQGKLQEELLNHISPLGWEHINFLGECKFNFRQNSSLVFSDNKIV